MRIKKKTSLMMIAASTAAVVGVAAVSFAAWTGSNSEISAGAQTGSAYLLGFESTDKIDFDKLVPYDQESGIKEGATITSKPLPAFEVATNEYTIEVKFDAACELEFWVLVGDKQTAVPENWNNGANKGDWQQVSTGGVTFTFKLNSAEDADANVGGIVETNTKYVSLMLVSDDNSDMDSAEVLFTITLSDGSVTE